MGTSLKVMWQGYGGHAPMVERLRPMIEELGMTLTTIHEHQGNPDFPNADVLWNLHTWVNEFRKADIVILPANIKKWPAKSCNKLTQALAFGKPVICSPQDSYLAVLEKYPESFMVAENDEEFQACMIKLRDNPEFREKMSKNALIAAQDYSLDAIGRKWLNELRETDKVDIIIPTYNNLPCLRLCLDSIRACTSFLHNIIVVNNGPDEAVHEYLDSQTDIIYIKKGRLNFSQANNIGIRARNSKYVCLLNDDTIVSKGWLTRMVGTIKRAPRPIGALGVLSNCDKGWLHNYDIKIGGIPLLPGSNTVEQITPIIPDIYNFESPYEEVIQRDWVAFYCTLIPRDVINKVGILDEKFVNSGEDVDLCRRIKNMDYQIAQDFNAFVFHFGAVGRKILESEDKGSYQAADRNTQGYLREKYDKKTVVLYSGPSWERWDFRSVDEGGIGGSETWQVHLAREFSKLGYRVKSFCDCPEQGIMDGDVEYLHFTSYPDWIEQNWIDYFISSRTTDTLRFPVRAGKIYVMTHDIWLLSEKTQLFMDRVDKFCVLSKWHWDFVKDYHGIPDEKLWMTSNGLDFDRFKDNGIERNPYRLIYSSSPDRGLDTLLYLFPFMKQEIPELELHIFYGFENWEMSIVRKGSESESERMRQIKAAMEQSGVFYHGRVGQKQLAQEFQRSSLWAYPTDFEESFNITAVEAQRARVPVVASNYAGLQTTVGNSGILIGSGQKGESYTKQYREKFVAACLEVLTDNTVWKHWSDRGFKNTEQYSWDNVAKKWKDEFGV